MLLNEPRPTEWDLHFNLLGVPVRVHPMFWVMGLILGSSGSGRELPPILIWVIAVFVSVLVHEMGHALVIRAMGVQPWITLYGMGGLTSRHGGRFEPKAQILVSFAGPAAGFVLALVVVLAIKATGRSVDFLFGWPFVVFWLFDDFPNRALNNLAHDLLFVNIWWGLLNLLPILPLDGGQITNQILNMTYPEGALRTSLIISLVVATAMAVGGGLRKPPDLFQLLLFGSLAFGSYQMLAAYGGNFRR